MLCDEYCMWHDIFHQIRVEEDEVCEKRKRKDWI